MDKMSTLNTVQISALLILSLLSSSEAFVVQSGNICKSSVVSTNYSSLLARRRRAPNDYEDYDDFEDDYEDDRYYDDLGRGYDRKNSGIPSPMGRSGGLRLPETMSKALLAGVFALGIGSGVTIDSAINTNPKDLASRDGVDRAAPNKELCQAYGASAMAFDQRVFVSFDPFNVYIAQADVKPACVLRPNNVVPVLQDRHLINGKEVSMCKNRMNTWAFVGDLNDQPQLSCVYESEDAQNEFLSNPKYGIGEDYLDDDREKMDKELDQVMSTKKDIKKYMTEGQYEKQMKGL